MKSVTLTLGVGTIVTTSSLALVVALPMAPPRPAVLFSGSVAISRC